MWGLIAGLLNALLVFANNRTLHVPGLDNLVFAVLITQSLSLAGVVVLLHMLADLRGLWRTWLIFPAALAAALVGIWSLWAGFMVYYLISIVGGYYSGLLGARFWSFIAVNSVLNGLLLVLFA